MNNNIIENTPPPNLPECSFTIRIVYMDDTVKTVLASFNEDVSHTNVAKIILSQLGMYNFTSDDPTPIIKEISVFDTSVMGTKYPDLDKWYLKERDKNKINSSKIVAEDTIDDTVAQINDIVGD